MAGVGSNGEAEGTTQGRPAGAGSSLVKAVGCPAVGQLAVGSQGATAETPTKTGTRLALFSSGRQPERGVREGEPSGTPELATTGISGVADSATPDSTAESELAAGTEYQ